MSIWAVYSRGQNHRLTYTETLYCEPHQNTLVVLLLRPAGGWRWVGGRIKGSRVLLSRKFHYPIDTDLPPSQRSLVLCVSTFLSHWKSVFQLLSSPRLLCFRTLRSWQLRSSALSLAEGIIRGLILIFQCGSEEVGCQFSDPVQPLRFCIKTG